MVFSSKFENAGGDSVVQLGSNSAQHQPKPVLGVIEHTEVNSNLKFFARN